MSAGAADTNPVGINAVGIDAVEYGDYARDRNGWFFGMTGPQLAAVVAAGFPALIAVGSRSWPLLVAWLPIWATVVVVIVVPIRGRSAARWFLDLILFAFGGVTGWSQWQSKIAAGTGGDLAEADLPGVLGGVRIHDGPPVGPSLVRPAIVQNCVDRTWAVVARIVHPGIGLVEPAGRDRIGAGFAQLHEIAARTELLELITIQVRSVPDDGAERSAWMRAHRTPGTPIVARTVNDDLAVTLMPAAVRTEVFITLVAAEASIARPAKQSGNGVDGRARVLYTVMAEIESTLRGSIGCTSVAWLDSPSLATVVRTGFAPGDQPGLLAVQLAADADADGGGGVDSVDGRAGTVVGSAERGAATHDRGIAVGVPVAAAGPSRARTAVGHYDHDAWSSVTDTIVLPDQGAVLGALAPVFIPSMAGERRCVSVFFAALPARRADRLVGREELSAATGDELRRRSGRLSRAKQRRDTARVTGMDEKLARGRALVRCTAAATVTVPSTWTSRRRDGVWMPRSAWPGSSPSAWTWPTTPASPPAQSRSASAYLGCEDVDDPHPTRPRRRHVARRLRPPAAAASRPASER